MARLKQRSDTYVTTVRGMCRSCRQIMPARVFIEDGQVWQQSLCPTCHCEPARIASDSRWYLDQVLRPLPDRSPVRGSHPPRNGCPLDCGPCTWHAASCQLPIISITNACNLRCPICFTYNRADRIYHMPVDEMRRLVDSVIDASGQVDLINITGGEPTLHPHLLQLLGECRRPEIGRITMNSNGIRLAEDTALCERLAELGVCVILSFNTFDAESSVRIHGADLVDTKLRAIDNLGRAGCRMGLLHVMIPGLTASSIPGILRLIRQNEHILSLTVQTMTYSGQGGGKFERRERVPIDEAARLLCAHSGGDLVFEDFLVRPAAHPLCYLTCYAFNTDGTFLPFRRFASTEQLEQLMRDSYLMRLDHGRDFLAGVINDLYAKGETKLLRPFRALVDKLFPTDRILSAFERQRVAESSVRTIYIHSHMDEESFDCSRAMHCPDLVPVESGRLVPACTYNLFYRMKDERFYVDS